MKCKKGYKKQKNKYSTGKWLKWYFEKRTTRRAVKAMVIQKLIKEENNDLENCCSIF